MLKRTIMASKKPFTKTNDKNPFIAISGSLKAMARREGIKGTIPSPMTLPVLEGNRGLFRGQTDYYCAGEAIALSQMLSDEWLKGNTSDEYKRVIMYGSEQEKAELKNKMTIMVDIILKFKWDVLQKKAIALGKEIHDEMDRKARVIDLVYLSQRLGPEVSVSLASSSSDENKTTWYNWKLRDGLTRAGRKNSFYIDVYGKGQNGKTNLGYLMLSQALGQDQWIYTNMMPSPSLKKKYPRAKWFVIHSIADLFIDTKEIPSILRVHIENAKKLIDGYHSEIGSVIVFDEAKMGLESNANSIAGHAHANFLQVKRHMGGTGVIYLGVQPQSPSFEDTFVTMKIECKSTITNAADELGHPRASYHFGYATDDDPKTTYLVYDIPQSDNRPPEVGVDLAIPVDFDSISVSEMIQFAGEPPRVESDNTADLVKFINEMGSYILETANYARDRIGMARMTNREIETSITHQMSGISPIASSDNADNPAPDSDPISVVPDKIKKKVAASVDASRKNKEKSPEDLFVLDLPDNHDPDGLVMD
jgi:hypothetical protein